MPDLYRSPGRALGLTKRQLDLLTFPRGSLAGLELTSIGVTGGDEAHDVEVGTGVCRADTDDYVIRHETAVIKRIDANWAEGTNQGGFPSGLTITASTTYHVFVIASADGTQTDAGWDTSLSASNLLADATDYAYYRRIASMKLDGSSNIRPFVQFGDWFHLGTPVQEQSGVATSTTAANITLEVPSGIRVQARMTARSTFVSAGAETNFYPPDAGALSPGGGASQILTIANSVQNAAQFDVWTNTSGQIAWDSDNTGSDVDSFLHGWMDYRGRYD